MSEIVFWVVVICAAAVTALFWVARSARHEPVKARKNDGSGDAGVVFARDSGGDCGGGDGGGGD
ncbi:hypothetical protein [Ensifer adhaerens]|uniref:hypothetical protein n=1 Tax=Ensifer adhaerens TaxID=106592 RepID=UPI00069EA54E|nr:hypothetical protein [Ensifer adhaerens]